MYDCNQAAQIIINKRKNGYYSAFNECEIPFVSKYQGLSDGEKLIWINLATRTTLDPNLSCRASQNQIADMVGKKANTIYKCIKNLVSLGFLKSKFDKEKRVNIYYVLLPKEGLEILQKAPNRGEKQGATEDNPRNVVSFGKKANNNLKLDLRKKIIGGAGNISGGPPEINHTLVINYINNIKKHNNHNNTEFPEPSVQNADALVLKLQEKVKEAQKNNPSISLFKANQLAYQCFSDEERELIHQTLIKRAEQKVLEEHKKLIESAAFKKKLKTSSQVPKSRTNHPKSKLVEMTFDGEHFVIEEEVKNQILGNIPQLYHAGKIKGEAGQKPLKLLIKEILYYVVKAGSMLIEPVSQLKRYFTARKVCLNGGWQRPTGLARAESIAREQTWQAIKRKEYETAKRYAGIRGYV